MNDLVTRLRDRAHEERPMPKPFNLLLDAAERISQQDAELERLRREVETVTGLWTFWNDKAVELAGKLTEARKALEWMADRDDRNGSLPDAYRKKIDETLATRQAQGGEE